MAHLSLSLFGPFQVALDGQPVTDFHSDKVRALLAYLAVESQFPHRRESLAGLLWPDWPESSARKNLTNTLYELRQTVGDREAYPPFLRVTRDEVQFNVASDHTLDVSRLATRLEQGREGGDAGVEALEKGLSLYRGPFLDGFSLADSPPFEEWVTLQRERFHRRAIDALEDLAAAHEQRGAFEPGIQAARRAVALDPLRERAHRQLMRLLALNGQRGAAMAQYDACCRALAEELAVEPEEETRALYERIRGEELTGPAEEQKEPARVPRKVGPCPYRGLSSFREADAPFFHGREAFTDRLVEAVHAQPLVAVVVGASGSGKSSVVHAGLLPRLSQEGAWQIVDFRPSGEPFRALSAALLPALEPGLAETDRLIQSGKLAQALEGEEVPLLDVVERILAQADGKSRLLLLADQFEELYTLCPQVETRRRFVDLLLAAAKAAEGRRPSPLVLLLTVRADFMAQALAHRPFVDALQEGSLLLGPMNREELRAAIEKPAEAQGARIETGLVERLLDDVGEEPGKLPLLEFALTLLWERLAEGWLTHAVYEAIGRVEGALARYAEEVYAELEEEERNRARRVFVQLVQPGEGTEDTRRVATRAELGEENWPLVQHLADRRLVVTSTDPTAGRETVEVVHEALIQRWERLRGWMDEDRAFRTWQERLRVALRSWEESQGDEGALLRGTPLSEAQVWLGRRGGELSPAERGYIQTSVVRWERRRRRSMLALASGLVVALLLVLLAGLQWRRAEEKEQEALRQASIGLASQAVSELEGASPERAVLLALEALQEYPYAGQAESALAQAVYAFKPYRILTNTEVRLRHAIWSPDGGRIAISGYEGIIKIYDSDNGSELLKFSERDLSDVVGLAWSLAGDRLVTASQALAVARVWDPETGALLLIFEGHDGAVNHVVLSRDGALALTAGEDGTARV